MNRRNGLVDRYGYMFIALVGFIIMPVAISKGDLFPWIAILGLAAALAAWWLLTTTLYGPK